MKKNVMLLTLIALFVLSLAGCGIKNNEQSTGNPINSSPTNSNTETEAWREAYGVFLRDYPVPENHETLIFSLKDMNIDGVPELLILLLNDYDTNGVLTSYSFASDVYKIGEYSDPRTEAGYRISDNPIFPGLFTCSWGGGVEHYGYLSIQKGQLVYEHLWDMDRTGDTPQEIDFSDEKELINESIDVYINTNIDTPDNLLNMDLINDENIDKVLGR